MSRWMAAVGIFSFHFSWCHNRTNEDSVRSAQCGSFVRSIENVPIAVARQSEISTKNNIIIPHYSVFTLQYMNSRQSCRIWLPRISYLLRIRVWGITDSYRLFERFRRFPKFPQARVHPMSDSGPWTVKPGTNDGVAPTTSFIVVVSLTDPLFLEDGARFSRISHGTLHYSRPILKQ